MCDLSAIIRLVPILLILISPTTLSAAVTWLKVETPDERIYSDVSPHDLIEFAVRYSAFRHVFNELLAPEGKRPPPSTILLFRKAESLRSYLAGSRLNTDNLTAYTTSVDSRALLVLALEGDRDAALTSTLEFDTTWMLQRVGYILPIWMSQGTGEVLSSLRIRKGNCVVGNPQERLAVPFDEQEPIPWSHFFEIGTSSPEYTGKKGAFTGIYQAQAWALMHLVLLGGDTFRERFQRLAKIEQSAQETASTESELKAVAALVGTAPKGLANLVWNHRHDYKTVQVSFDEKATRASLAAAPAPEAEIRVQLTDLYASVDNQLDAEVQLNRALELAPQSVIVKEAQARAERRKGNLDLAVHYYREAMAAGSTDGDAYLISATDRIDANRSGGLDREGSGGKDIAQAILELHRSLELAPGDGAAYRCLGRAFYVAPTVTEEEIAELTPALLDPDNGTAVRFYRALLYHRLGHAEQFEIDLRHIAADPSASAELRSAALKQLQQASCAADQKKVEQLAGQKKFAEARALIDAALQRPDDSVDAGSYRRLRNWLVDTEAQANLSDLYQGQQWAELQKAADAYLEQRPNGGLAATARRLRTAAEQALNPPTAPSFSSPSSEPAPEAAPLPGPKLGIHYADPEFARYRTYVAKLMARVHASWKEPADSGLLPAAGSRVSVTVVESSDGTIGTIVRVDATPGVSEMISKACTNAIMAPSSFGAWTDKMIDDLGNEQTLIISFMF